MIVNKFRILLRNLNTTLQNFKTIVLQGVFYFCTMYDNLYRFESFVYEILNKVQKEYSARARVSIDEHVRGYGCDIT